MLVKMILISAKKGIITDEMKTYSEKRKIKILY